MPASWSILNGDLVVLTSALASGFWRLYNNLSLYILITLYYLILQV